MYSAYMIASEKHEGHESHENHESFENHESNEKHESSDRFEMLEGRRSHDSYEIIEPSDRIVARMLADGYSPGSFILKLSPEGIVHMSYRSEINGAA